MAFTESDVLSDRRPRIFSAPFERLVSQPNDTVGIAGRSSFGARITAKAQSCAGNREIALWAASSSAIDDADFLELAGVSLNPIGDARSLGGIAARRWPGGQIVLDFAHSSAFASKPIATGARSCLSNGEHRLRCLDKAAQAATAEPIQRIR
ncbi:hypothetical protein [Bradyrhizobium brasilense]|uniref:hypothetical protein n=1 Tax=Bradyrhizobium brasilense TaxID=1419277 RepID=UPI0011776902|nr:hypothetical protein [Bradyrhizobium brasilense]